MGLCCVVLHLLSKKNIHFLSFGIQEFEVLLFRIKVYKGFIKILQICLYIFRATINKSFFLRKWKVCCCWDLIIDKLWTTNVNKMLPLFCFQIISCEWIACSAFTYETLHLADILHYFHILEQQHFMFCEIILIPCCCLIVKVSILYWTVIIIDYVSTYFVWK